MDQNDLLFMDLAIDEAGQSAAEDEQVHPKVGAVFARDGAPR